MTLSTHSYGFVLGLVLVTSCVTGGSDHKDKDVKKDGSSAENKADGMPHEDEFYVSGNLNTFTTSLTNNPLTSKRVDKQEASSFAAKLEGTIKASKGDDRKSLVALMSLRRIAGEGLGPVMEIARQLVALEVKKNVEHGIPEFAKLELVLAAVQAKKFSYAEYFIGELARTKNKKIKAATLTAEGIIAALDDRLPEAVESWTKALEVVPDFEPALMNIGFIALKYGDFPRAKKALGSMQGDWFGAYGLVTAERMTKDTGKASELCKRILGAKPRYKPALFNCALNAYQGEKNYDEAISFLDRMTKISGNSGWDEKAVTLRHEIEHEAAKARSGSKQDDKKKKS